MIEDVEDAEVLLDVNNAKKKADENYCRIRVGNYRIGFTKNEGVITFVRVLHRKEMYRYFP